MTEQEREQLKRLLVRAKCLLRCLLEIPAKWKSDVQHSPGATGGSRIN